MVGKVGAGARVKQSTTLLLEARWVGGFSATSIPFPFEAVLDFDLLLFDLAEFAYLRELEL